MSSTKVRILFCLIPLTLSLLFAAGMFFLAKSVATHSREIYQSQKKLKALKKELELYGLNGEVENRRTRNIGIMTNGIVIFALGMTFFGFKAALDSIGINPFSKKKIKFLRDGIDGVLITGSFALCLFTILAFLWYVWMLRTGLI